MQRVIGLDIGSYSIKAVEIINTFNSYEIVNFHENIVPVLPGIPVSEIAPHCMEQLFIENGIKADRIVTAMPGQFISSRVVTLGFSDPRKVKAAILAEIEDAVPFQMEDMVFDHQILSSTAQQTFALAVMTRKKFLASFLDLLKRININPKLVDVDSLAFYNLSTQLGYGVNDCIAMVDIGHEKTSVCIIKDGVLRMFRSINLGGRYITEFLARDLEKPFHEAQRIKHDCSRILCEGESFEGSDPKDAYAIERMGLACQAISKELGRTFYAFKSWEKTPIHTVYISGGTSVIKGMDRFLEEQLRLEVKRYDLQHSGLKISDHLVPYTAIIPQSVAIGIRTVSSVKKSSQINLRKGEFAYTESYDALIAAFGQGLKIAAVVLVMLVGSYGLKKFIYQKHIDKVREQYRTEFLAIMPDQASLFNEADFRGVERRTKQRLETRIASMQQSIEKFKLATQSSDALIVLQNLSNAIPKTISVDVVLFDFKKSESGGQLVLQGETEGYAKQAEFVDALKKSPHFFEVEEKRTELKPGTDGKIVTFNVTASTKRG
jgi:type IV pilus assembly protein PilM